MNKTIIFLLFLSLIASSCNHRPIDYKINSINLDRLTSSLSTRIEEESERIENELFDQVQNLSEPSRVNFMPAIKEYIKLGNMIKNWNNHFAKIYQAEEQLQPITYRERRLQLQQLNNLLNSKNDSLLMNYQQLLQDHHESLGLLFKEMSQVLQSVEEEYELRNRQKVPIDSNIENDAIYSLNLIMVQDSGLQSFKFFKSLLDNLTSGKTIGDWQMQFPIILPHSGCVSVGENFEAEVAIGTYVAEFDPKVTKLFVNDTPLIIDSNGIANFVKMNKKPGKVDLTLRFEMLNKLTGQKISNESIYTYTVH